MKNFFSLLLKAVGTKNLTFLESIMAKYARSSILNSYEAGILITVALCFQNMSNPADDEVIWNSR